MQMSHASFIKTIENLFAHPDSKCFLHHLIIINNHILNFTIFGQIFDNAKGSFKLLLDGHILPMSIE